MDIARVEVLLTDWDEAIHLRSGKKDPFDAENYYIQRLPF
jgi:hypothetical protein